MISRRVRRLAVAALAASCLIVAGCAGDDSNGKATNDPDSGGVTNPGSGEAAGLLAGYLATIPAAVLERHGDGLVHISVADLDRAAELAGVTRPAGSTDPEAVREYVGALASTRVESTVYTQFPHAASVDRLQEVEEFAAEVGWSIADVSWFAEYQVQPDVFTVLGGDFDVDRLADAMGEQPDDGIWRLGGDDHSIDMTEVSPARPIGQALRLALVADDQLVVARSTPPVEAALEGTATTVDDPVLSALVAALDAQEAYSATFIIGDLGPSREGLPQQYTGVAAGTAYVDGTPYALLVYTHDDEAAAHANADGLRTLLEEGTSLSGRPWSESFGADEIRVDGTTVTARLTLKEASAYLVYQIIQNRDTLVTLS